MKKMIIMTFSFLLLLIGCTQEEKPFSITVKPVLSETFKGKIEQNNLMDIEIYELTISMDNNESIHTFPGSMENFKINAIIKGTYSITLSGYNSLGFLVTRGTLIKELTEPEELSVDMESSKMGSLDLSFAVPPESVRGVTYFLELTIIHQTENGPLENSFPLEPEDDNHNFKMENIPLPPGYHEIIVTLSSSQINWGFRKIIVIQEDKKANWHFSLPEREDIETASARTLLDELDIKNSSQVTIKGVKGSIVEGENLPVSAAFTAKKIENPAFLWALNGKILEGYTNPEIDLSEISPPPGVNHLDVIVSNDKERNSRGFDFAILTPTPTPTPTPMSIISTKPDDSYNYHNIAFLQSKDGSDQTSIYKLEIITLNPQLIKTVDREYPTGAYNVYCDNAGKLFTYSTSIHSGDVEYAVFYAENPQDVTLVKSLNIIKPSPDGKKIFFTSNDHYGDMETDYRSTKLYISDPRQNEIKHIDTSKQFSSIKWSLDSNYLYYIKNGDISMYNTQTGDISSMPLIVTSHTNLALSPNNKYMLFGDYSAKTVSVYNTSDWSLHTKIEGDSVTWGVNYCWSPDSRSFVYNSAGNYIIRSLDDGRETSFSVDDDLFDFYFALLWVNIDNFIGIDLDTNFRLFFLNINSLSKQRFAQDLPGNHFFTEDTMPCPFVYIHDGAGFVQDVEVIRGISSKEMESTQTVKLKNPVITGGVMNIEIREIKDEISYLDSFCLIIDGKKYYPDDIPAKLGQRDNNYLILEKGDIQPLTFSGLPENAETVYAQASGYYELTK